MKVDEFRKLALSLPGAVESAHMEHPDFRVAGNIFATLGYPDDEWGMVKLTPQQQQSLVAADPRAFQPCSGAWGKSGCTNVRLAASKKTALRAAMEMAYENVFAAAPVKRKKASRTSAGRSKRGKSV